MSATNDIERLGELMVASLEEVGQSYQQDLKILPDVKVIKIGGQSITDRGRVAMFPVLDEIVACKKEFPIIISTGGGTRARHTYQVGMDLGMPTGILADMGHSIAFQNARMIQMLLAKHGGILTNHDEFGKFPVYLQLGCIPIISGMPPYSLWEEIPEKGSIPMNRTDTGVFFLGEVLGVESILFIKDEKGLFTEDPKKNPKAEFIPKIHAEELKKMDLGDLIVERVVLDYLLRSKNVKELQIINGLEKGNVTKALHGEHVGTIIYRD